MLCSSPGVQRLGTNPPARPPAAAAGSHRASSARRRRRAASARPRAGRAVHPQESWPPLASVRMFSRRAWVSTAGRSRARPGLPLGVRAAALVDDDLCVGASERRDPVSAQLSAGVKPSTRASRCWCVAGGSDVGRAQQSGSRVARRGEPCGRRGSRMAVHVPRARQDGLHLLNATSVIGFVPAARENTMQTVPVSALVLFALVYTMSSAAAQPLVGALAVDERQGDQYGWAVDYETAAAAQAAALRECGGGCRVVLTFERCAAYAADQDAGSTAVGWAESFASSSSAQQAALSACSSRGGTGCIVRFGAATGRWSRRVWVSTARRASRFSRASRRRASTRGVRTGCSVPARARRSGAGKRLGALVRRAIWTVRRCRHCGHRRWVSRRSASGSRPVPTRLRLLPSPVRSSRLRRARNWRACSGNR